VTAVQFAIEFPLRVVVYPAPDIKGQWIAHGLETDIVTQGDSPEHAMEMMADALKTTIDYAARRQLIGAQGLPFTLRPAPREVWDLIGESVPSGVRARATISRKSAVKDAPTSWPMYTFVSKKSPAFADAG
jgi:hypothetical protein